MCVRKATTMATVAVLFAAIMVLATAQPAAASNRYWATGAGESYLPLRPFCGQVITYRANTPLIIAHGWGDTPWVTEPLKGAFMAPTTTFELQLDSVTQKSVQAFRYFPETDTMSKFFVSEYDQGLTGTHSFVGNWYLDGALVSGAAHEAVFVGTCEVTVSFV